MKPNLVIIGNGMAAIRTLEELLAACPDKYRITVLGREPFGAYNRILLSPVLAGEASLDEILIHDRPWYEAQGITLLAGPDHEAQRIDRSRRQVICRDGARLAYDRLLIATGSEPAILPIPGREAEGVMGFRGIADVERMQKAAAKGGSAVVIGAGLLGLEAAHGLNTLGLSVTVIHRARHLLNRQLDVESAELLQRALQARGIAFRLGVESRRIHSDGGRVRELELTDGERLDADLVVMATGILPNTALAERSGLACHRGIRVNDCLQTFDPRIYAVGECVEHRGTTFGLVEPLFEQARVCANHLAAHGVARYRYRASATRLKVSGIRLFSAGEFDPADNGSSDLIHYRDPGLGIYKKLVIRDNRLVGVLLYGDTDDGPGYCDLMRDGVDLAPCRGGLVFGLPNLEAAPGGAP